MRFRLFSLSLLMILISTAVAQATAPPTYYLALGDSLSIGVQPSPNGDIATNQGYADDLFIGMRTRIPGLRLAKLGCSG